MTREARPHVASLALDVDVDGPMRRPTHADAIAGLYGRLGYASPDGDAAARKARTGRIARATILAAAAMEPALRDDQVGFLEALERHAADPRTAPVASTVQPGASGKTTLMMRFVKAASEDPETAPDGRRRPPRVVMLAPTKVILRQIREAGRELSMDALLVNVDDVRGVAVATAMTHARFAAMVESGSIGPDDVDVLVVDEVHRMLSERRVAVLDRFLGRTYVVAATASPRFSATKDMDLVLGEDNRVWSVTNARMRAIGAIATVTNVLVGVKITGPMPEDRAERALTRRQAISEALVALLTEGCPGFDRDLCGQTFLFYAQDVAHARMTSDLYDLACSGHPGLRGYHCRSICGYDERDHVIETVRALEEGEITGISNVLLLGEGYDLPRIRVVANAPTGSPVRQNQQSARAQRVDRADPEGGSHCTVIDFYVEENGELHGRPRWFYEVIGEADKAERPLAYGYDTRREHADLTPYRGLSLVHERSIDGAWDRGPADASRRRGPGVLPMPDLDGGLTIDWSVESVVELGRGIRRRVADRCEDELDAAGCAELAAPHGVSRAAVTSSYRILARSIAEDAAGTSLCGLRLRPVLRRWKGRTVVCLDLGEADQLVAALADERDGRTRTLEGETRVSGRFMRALYTVPDPDAERTFLEDVRAASGLGRPFELRDGATLATRVLGADMPTVLFPRADAARVADHLGLATRTPSRERPLGPGDVTLRRWRDMAGAPARAGRRDFAGALWSRLAGTMREGEETCLLRVAGTIVELTPRAASTALGAEVAIPRAEAASLMRTLAGSGASQEGGERPLRRPWTGAALPREDRPVDTRARLAHFLPRLEARLAGGAPCTVHGVPVEARRTADGFAVGPAQARAILGAMGLSDDARRFLDRTQVEARIARRVGDDVWDDLAAQWREAGTACLGGVELRGNAGRREGPEGTGISAGGASVPAPELHPDDLDALRRALLAGI